MEKRDNGCHADPIELSQVAQPRTASTLSFSLNLFF